MAADRATAGVARSATVGRSGDIITGWLLLGSTVTESGPWNAGWKGSPELRPMNAPILKVLLICGCRFADQQIAACGAVKIGRWERARRVGDRRRTRPPRPGLEP